MGRIALLYNGAVGIPMHFQYMGRITLPYNSPIGIQMHSEWVELPFYTMVQLESRCTFKIRVELSFYAMVFRGG